MHRHLFVILILPVIFWCGTANAETKPDWTYTTIFGSPSRINNIKIAVNAINNVEILPGKEFSYNAVVGERTPNRGFKEAGGLFNGQHVTTIGGGICQVSSTLFQEVKRHPGIRITEHHKHSKPVRYGKNGADATVSWGAKDFRFVNQFSYPVKILANIVEGRIIVRVIKAN